MKESPLVEYRASLGSGSPQQFLGHNPPGRLAIKVLSVCPFNEET
jgi:hypothetical protein